MEGKGVSQLDWLVNVENKDSILRITDLDQDDDLERKPNHSYASLIRNAILSSPNQRCTLANIYEWIEDKYPFFRRAGKGWKNSIRHNLSLNKSFRKLIRAPTDPGKGCYWTFNQTCDEEHGDNGNRGSNNSCPRRGSNRARVKSNNPNMTPPLMVHPCSSSSESVAVANPVFSPDPWWQLGAMMSETTPIKLSPSSWSPSNDHLSAAMRMSGLYDEHRDSPTWTNVGVSNSDTNDLMMAAMNATPTLFAQAADVFNHVSKKDLSMEWATSSTLLPSSTLESLTTNTSASSSRRRSSSHSLRGLLVENEKHAPLLNYNDVSMAQALFDELNWDAIL